jgi:hypothetical protein
MRFRVPLAAVVATLAFAPSSLAATVSVSEQIPGDPLSDIMVVLVVDTASETNRMSVSYTYTHDQDAPFGVGPGSVTVRDTGVPPTPGEGCEQAAVDTVRCEVDALGSIRVLLGPGADVASVTPETETACASCAQVFGEEENDELTNLGGASLDGGEGDDTLVGKRSPATRTPDALATPNDDGIAGGPGNDMVSGGLGDDSLQGGPGDDTVLGHSGDDHLTGGLFSTSQPQGPAGRDRLDAGSGDDELNDGDVMMSDLYAEEVGPDTLIGGRGEDQVLSYTWRTKTVTVDLAVPGRDGEKSEGDSLVNVEILYGSLVRDLIAGDGDDNAIQSGRGASSVLNGRGGDDSFLVRWPARHTLFGGVGDDHIETAAWARGTFSCGRGSDRVRQRITLYGRQPDPARNLGPVLKGDCERVTPGFQRVWALAPKPRLRGRRLTFRKVRGTTHRADYELILTKGDKPFERIARKPVGRRGVTVRLPRRLARRGGLLRAVVVQATRGEQDVPRLIWRFRF